MRNVNSIPKPNFKLRKRNWMKKYLLHPYHDTRVKIPFDPNIILFKQYPVFPGILHGGFI